MREMNSPAPGKGRDLNKELRTSKFSKNPKHFHAGKNGKKILDELARKWVRFGCATTPNEAMKVLLEGDSNV